MTDQKKRVLSVLTIIMGLGSIHHMMHAPEDLIFDQPTEQQESQPIPLTQEKLEQFKLPKNQVDTSTKEDLSDKNGSTNVTDSGVHLKSATSQTSSEEPVILSRTQRFKNWINNRSFDNFTKIFQSNRELLTDLISKKMENNAENPLEEKKIQREIHKLSRQDRQKLLTDITEKEISLLSEPLSLSQARKFFINNASKYQLILPENELIIPIEKPSRKDRSSFQFEIINVSSVQNELETLNKLNPDPEKLNEIANTLKNDLNLKLRISDIENNLKKYLQSLLIRQEIDKAHALLAEPTPQPSAIRLEPIESEFESEEGLTNSTHDSTSNLSTADESLPALEDHSTQEFQSTPRDIKNSYNIVQNLKQLKLTNNQSLFGIIFDQYKDRLSPEEIEEVEIYDPYQDIDAESIKQEEPSKEEEETEKQVSGEQPAEQISEETSPVYPNKSDILTLEPIQKPNIQQITLTPDNVTDEQQERLIQESQAVLEQLRQNNANVVQNLENYLNESHLEQFYNAETKTWTINPEKEITKEIYNIMKNNSLWKNYNPDLKRYISNQLYRTMFQDDVENLETIIEQNAFEKENEAESNKTSMIPNDQNEKESSATPEQYQQFCENVFTENIFKEYDYIVQALKYRDNLGYYKNRNITHEDIIQKLLETQISDFKNQPESIQEDIIKSIALKYQDDLNDLAIQNNQKEALKKAQQKFLAESVLSEKE